MSITNPKMSPKENIIRVITHDRPDHVPYYLEGERFQVTHGLKGRPERAGLDDWGVEWGFADERIGTYPKKPALRSLDDIKHFIPPDPEAKGLFDEAQRQIAEIDRENILIVAWNASNVFERAWLLIGMENLLCAMLTEPDELKPLFRMLSDISIVLAERFIGLGVDAIHYGDDWGTQDRLFVHPELWRELIKPEVARMYEAVKKREVFVFQHTDGRVEDIVGDLVELGVDWIDPWQPNCNDLPTLKSKYGDKVTFKGAVDSQYVLTLGSPEEVEEETKLRIEQLAPGGGYVCGPSHFVPFPDENIAAMVNATKKYGKYVYD